MYGCHTPAVKHHEEYDVHYFYNSSITISFLGFTERRFIMVERKLSVSANAGRARSASCVQSAYVNDPDIKRNHSSSVSSVTSNMSEKFDSTPLGKGKIYLRDDQDLENQIIITAGGRRENILCFLLKLAVLTAVALGCGVLVFYAL